MNHRAAPPTPDGRIRIVPSLLAADFGRLAQAVRLVEAAGAEWLSFDVMDGRFVPNLGFSPAHVRALRPRTRMSLEAHLMVEYPRRFIRSFAEAGADWVTVHLETCTKPREVLRAIRSSGAKAGLALKPETPASSILPFLKDLDLALVMTVEPGFGGRKFLRGMLPKIRELREAIAKKKFPVWLMADGGIGPETAPLAALAGADALVAGTAVFGTRDPRGAFRHLQRLAQKGFESRRR